MKNYIDLIYYVNSSDPEDFRRRRLLNILLLGIFVILLLNIFSFFVIPELSQDESAPLLILGVGIFFVGTIIIYLINRRSGKWAAFLFLFLLTLAVNLTDTPSQLANGRS